MEGHEDSVTLRLTGENAKGGIELSALQQFVGHFVGALRRFDRVGRAEPAVKGGHPERRAEAVTAFRLVQLTKGSAVLTLEPVTLEDQAGEPLFDEGDNPPLDNVQAMTAAMAAGERLDPAVADALDNARRALGGDSSAIEISLPRRLATPPFRLDRAQIERAREEDRPPSRASTISGRLHAVDLEPDKLAVRSPQGIDWTCRYPEALESQVKALIDEIVVVEGQGQQRSPRAGSMEIQTIRRAYDHDQPVLFSEEQVGLEELREMQGAGTAQGLSSMGDPEWQDDETGARQSGGHARDVRVAGLAPLADLLADVVDEPVLLDPVLSPLDLEARRDSMTSVVIPSSSNLKCRPGSSKGRVRIGLSIRASVIPRRQG